MSDDDEPTEPKVGYKNPPQRTRFAKGVSGNPKGRPKGAKGFKAELAKVMNETFPVGGGRKRVSARTAMLLKKREKAIKGGDNRAGEYLLNNDRALEEEAEAKAFEKRRAEIEEEDKALLEAALRRLGGATP